MKVMAAMVNEGTAPDIEPNLIDGAGTNHSATLSREISSSRETFELAKLNVEREKLELEVAQLRALALGPEEQRTKAQNEREKDGLELQKLRHEVEVEAKNARLSQYFEIGKVIIPALSIFGSVWIATRNLQYQHDKDRATAVSEQLVHFQENITSMKDAASNYKQRNAIAAVRALREDAIPSLLANIDLSYPEEIIRALQQAILKLNEDPYLRSKVLEELLSSIKYTGLRHDIPRLQDFVSLWGECINQYKRTDEAFFQNAVFAGNNLAKELHQNAEAFDTKDVEGKAELIRTIDKLSTKPGG